MKHLLTVILFTMLFVNSAQSAVVGAGDLAWESFYEDGARVMKYNRESFERNIRSYQARIWLYTKFKQPFIRPETDGLPVKYIFQHVIFDCMQKNYTQTEFIVFDWDNEENIGHLMTNEIYSVVAASPMDKLWGISCTFNKKY